MVAAKVAQQQIVAAKGAPHPKVSLLQREGRLQRIAPHRIGPQRVVLRSAALLVQAVGPAPRHNALRRSVVIKAAIKGAGGELLNQPLTSEAPITPLAATMTIFRSKPNPP